MTQNNDHIETPQVDGGALAPEPAEANAEPAAAGAKPEEASLKAAGPSAEQADKDAGEQAAASGKRNLDRSAILKFAGLVAFVVLIAIIVAIMWPYIADVFTEGGVERLVERVRNAGPAGVLMLIGMQLLQIIVAVIPGEVVQLAAGLMYGPFFGSLIILVGCVMSSAIVYLLVHALGAPFVQSMVPTEYLEKFRKFEKSGKLDIVVFVLFLIPAMPKDVFTYLVPLTDMKMGRFLLLSNVARIPGIVASTYVAHGLSEGQMVGPIIIVAIVAVAAVIAVLFRDKIMDALGRGKDE